VLLCAVLSVVVVLKRLAFIGQGISHSAFGGIGVGAVVGVLGAGGTLGLGEFLIVLAFCMASAIGMALVSADGDGGANSVEADTAIGVFLVASMALGAVLLAYHMRAGRMTGSARWEAVLFGQILTVDRTAAVLAGAVAVIVLGVVWWFRRAMLFWAFDEAGAATFGVRTTRMRLLLMVLLALATVTAMKLVGVVLATALLVLPGASALRWSARIRPVMFLSCVLGVVGLLAGTVASLEMSLPTGACIVLALTAVFGVSACFERLTGRRARVGSRAVAAEGINGAGF
jgi:zinc transport system permease protein